MRVPTKLWKRIETLKKEKEGLLIELENLEKIDRCPYGDIIKP